MKAREEEKRQSKSWVHHVRLLWCLGDVFVYDVFGNLIFNLDDSHFVVFCIYECDLRSTKVKWFKKKAI